MTKEVEEVKGPSIDDLVEIKLEEEKEKLRGKAEEWAEKKAEQKALVMFEKEKELSMEMKQFNDMKTQLTWMQEQNALPKGETAGQTLMKMRMGKQMGMSEYEAINGIAFVNGRMCVWGEVMMGMLAKAGYQIDFQEWTKEKCTIKISKGERNATNTYTLQDAKDSGLYPGNSYSPWTKFTKMMLAYKAVREVSKFFCPEVLGGAMTVEEARTELQQESSEKSIPTPEDIENKLKNKFTKNEQKGENL